MAKNSGGEKFPFFQEARLEITICITVGFEAFDSLNCWQSKLFIEVEQKEGRVMARLQNTRPTVLHLIE